MKKKLYRYLSILLLTVIMCTSCSRSVNISLHNNDDSDTDIETETTTSSSSSGQDDDSLSSKEAKAEQERFDEFTEALFKDILSESVLSVHSILDFPENYGITEYEYTLGDISHEASDETVAEIKEYIETMNEFNYDYLTSVQQLTYDIMYTDFQDSLALENYYLFNDYLSPLHGMPSSLPSYLGQFSFNNTTDVKDYLEILKLIPDYFNDIIAFQTEKTEAGMGLPDFEIEEIIDQCNEFTANTDDHFLITSFNERVDKMSGVSDTDRTSYKKENEDIIKNTIIPIYKDLAVKLADFKGKATVEGGLCQYKNGDKYYEILVRTETASDMSVKEIKKLLEDKMDEDIMNFSTLMYKDENLYDKIEDYDFDTSDPDKILEYLLGKIKTDFPEGYETNYTINEVPKSLEKYQSPAYYYIPSIDNVTVNNIFINKYSDYADMDLYPVLAHEAFPGHMYQTTYFQNTNPAPIRSLFRYTGYLEGWGLYSELYSYDLSGQSKDVAKFNRVINCLAYDIYCLADIGINYEGWSREDTVEFVTSIGYDEEAGNSVYESMIEDPCTYLTYYLGYLEFMDMKEQAKDALGKAFNAKTFHKFLLDIGPAQFEIIHDRFDEWLDLQKNAA